MGDHGQRADDPGDPILSGIFTKSGGSHLIETPYADGFRYLYDWFLRMMLLGG